MSFKEPKIGDDVKFDFNAIMYKAKIIDIQGATLIIKMGHVEIPLTWTGEFWVLPENHVVRNVILLSQ